ncbi:hypothetical protein LTR85_012035 [Meristemomyces frigidus]|nr:hypothetical protein LTR85_012035 [Meristemomyces frigidus]
MALLNLPPELLDDIIGHTLPDGLESFALSCKTVYAIGKEHIARHNAYKREWKHFAYSEGGPAARPRTALQLVHAIAQDRHIAYYIENMYLRNDEVDGAQQREAASATLERIRTDEISLRAIKRLLADSPYLKAAEQNPEVWWRRIQLDDEYPDEPETNYATVFLLTLLPNVRELTLPFDWKNLPGADESFLRPNATHLPSILWPPRVWPVLDAIAQQAGTGVTGGAALGKLERVLPYADASYDTRNGLRELGAFMAFPALRELYACNCVAVQDGYTGIPFKWRYPDLKAGLSRIELAGCCIDADGISELVKHTPRLQTLKYSHHTKWHG